MPLPWNSQPAMCTHRADTRGQRQPPGCRCWLLEGTLQIFPTMWRGHSESNLKAPTQAGYPPSLTYGKSGPLTSPGFPCPGWPPHSKAASQQLSADTPGSTWARLTLGQIVNWVWGPSKISPFGITLSPPLLSISPGSQGWGVCSGHQTHLSRDEEI